MPTIQQFYQDAMKKSTSFFAGSEFYRLRKEYAMSAFMLHQAAEQTLRAILKIGTGYNSCTHNLNRLLKYASMVSYELPDVFAHRRDKDQQLLNLLQKAYSDARYGTDYTVTLEQLITLTEKVNRILQILTGYNKSICNK